MSRICLLTMVILLLLAAVASARTWVVDSGGGGDALTIQAGIDSADPAFCDTSFMGVTVESCSPCMMGYHPDSYDCGYPIGSAVGAGCNCGEATEPATWGSIKSLYR